MKTMRTDGARPMWVMASLAVLALSVASASFAAGFENYGSVVRVSNGAVVRVDGDFVNRDGGAVAGKVANYGLVQVEGDWSNASSSGEVFTTDSNGAVALIGVNQAIGGRNSFPNLAKVSPVPAALTFGAGTTNRTTVKGNLVLRGSSDTARIALRSSIDGAAWEIDPQGARNLDFLDVKDSNNVNAAVIDVAAADCLNAGNNTKWKFGYEVNFLTDGNGTIDGEAVQNVRRNQDCSAVTAVPNSGYYFVQWTGDYEGVENPLTITGVTQDMNVTATFSTKPPPVVANPIADVTVDEDADPTVISLNDVFVVGDGSPIAKVVQSNSNETLVVASIVEDSLTLTYQKDQYGEATIVIRATANEQTADDSFTVTVNPINDPPSISSIPDQTTLINAPTPSIPFQVDDPETGPDALTVSAISSDATLIPVGNVALGGEGMDRTVTVTPAEDQYGYATITLTVKAGPGPEEQASTSFDVYVIETPSLLKDIRPGDAQGSDIEYLTLVGDRLFFRANDGTHGVELWKSDGGVSGTRLVKDVNPGAANGYSYMITGVDSTAFFVADDGAHGYELWKSDGSAVGTAMVKDIAPGPGSSSPFNLTQVGDGLFFTATDAEAKDALWKSNGAESGTVMVKSFLGSYSPYNDYPTFFTNLNGTLCFTANDAVDGDELWKSDGTTEGTAMVKNINPGGDSSPYFLKNVNGLLFFCANDGVNGYQPWRSDATAAGTVMLTGANKGDDSIPYGFTAVDGIMYFSIDDGAHGYELWRSDGTDAGTWMVKDINPGRASGYPQDITAINGILYFSADDGVHGAELWKSDGAEAGTVLVKDILPGEKGSEPRNLANAADTLCFSANDGAHGFELWKSGGTAATTMLVRDIFDGPESSFPNQLVAMGASLYFVADDGIHGRELWQFAPRAHEKTQATVAMLVSPKRAGVISNGGSSLELSVVTAGMPRAIRAVANSGYAFVRWDVAGAATVDQPYSDVTSVIVEGGATITAVFARSSELNEVVVASADETLGTVNPTGTITVIGGQPVTLSATPNMGGMFKEWFVTGDIDIDNPAAATARLSASGPGTVTAVFVTETPESENCAHPRISIVRSDGKTSSDRVNARDLPLPDDVDFASFSPNGVSVVVDGTVFNANVSSEWTMNENRRLWTCKASSGSGCFRLDLDFQAGTWSFIGNKIDLSFLDNSNGVDFVLNLGERNVGCNHKMDESVKWTFNASRGDSSEALTGVDGPLTDLKIEKATGLIDLTRSNRDKIAINKATFYLPANERDEVFNPETDVVAVSFDAASVVATSDVWRSKRSRSGKMTGDVDEADARIRLDLVRGRWSFQSRRSDLSGVQPGDGIDVYLTLGSSQAGVRIHPDCETRLSYPRP